MFKIKGETKNFFLNQVRMVNNWVIRPVVLLEDVFLFVYFFKKFSKKFP